MSNYSVLIDQTLADPAFRAKLLADPAATAAAAGVALPAGVTLKVVEDAPMRMNLVIGGITDDTPDEAAALLAKAESNPKFKAKLLADPKGTAQMESGVMLPDSFEVEVFENTPTAVYLVLPPAEGAEGELSDMELEAVAGGKGRRRRSSPPPRNGGGNPPATGIAGTICLAL